MKRKIIITILLSIIYSTSIIIGISFNLTSSFKYIYDNLLFNIILYIGLILIIYLILNKLFNILDSIKINNKSNKLSNSKLLKLFNKRPMLFSFIFIIICWLPYIISFYPAILSPDPSFQIRQFFGIPNKYSEYSIMIDPNVTITNHHPVVHTLLLGTCVKIGQLINNINLGLFIYSIIQITILALTLSYTIKFLKDLKINKKYLIAMLLIYSFIPIYPFYSMSCVKDVIFGSLIILYIMCLYKLIKTNDINNKNIFKVIILSVLIILFRHNGIHTLILSFPFLLFMKKRKKYKFKLLIILICILVFNISYNKVILPFFKITPTSIRETLSIPFQQTARYVKYHDEEVTKEEREVIDKILEYDTLKDRYDGVFADPVKNKYNRYATKEDLNKYFKVWFEEFKKHPDTYLEATINNNYGYFFPKKNRLFIYYKFDSRITNDGFDYHYNNLDSMRKLLSGYAYSIQKIPIINIFVNIGLNVYILMFMFSYLFYKKKYQELIYLLPSFVIFLVCLASPVNAYFRYALPFVFALMLNFGIFWKEGVLNEK